MNILIKKFNNDKEYDKFENKISNFFYISYIKWRDESDKIN